MVEVFKTNVQKAAQAKRIVAALLQCFPGCLVNFDLDDCDKILRVEAPEVIACNITAMVNHYGFTCEVLL